MHFDTIETVIVIDMVCMQSSALDFLAAIPYDLIGALVKGANIMRMVRLVRLVRIARLSRVQLLVARRVTTRAGRLAETLTRRSA